MCPTCEIVFYSDELNASRVAEQPPVLPGFAVHHIRNGNIAMPIARAPLTRIYFSNLNNRTMRAEMSRGSNKGRIFGPRPITVRIRRWGRTASFGSVRASRNTPEHCTNPCPHQQNRINHLHPRTIFQNASSADHRQLQELSLSSAVYPKRSVLKTQNFRKRILKGHIQIAPQ